MKYSQSTYLYRLLLLMAFIKQVLSETTRIVGGGPTNNAAAPYIVYIEYQGKFRCGGALITPQHILTAAHCVAGSETNQLTVVAGATYLYLDGVRQTAIAYKIPKTWNALNMKNDVALIKVAQPFVNAVPIGLCTVRIQVGMLMRVSGWGRLTETVQDPSNQLHTTVVVVNDRASCSQSYRGIGKEITGSMFCAAWSGIADSCQGDSGGPLVFNNELCGIVSWGRGCARPQFPGVYTSVNFAKPFIYKWMEDM